MLRHLLATAVFLPSALLAQATTVQIPCARDNTLYESPTGALSGGAGTGLFIGRTSQFANSRRRAVVRFDVAASVPSGARIISATLTVNVAQSSFPGVLDVTGHRLLQDWGEGTSVPLGGGGGGGAPATTNDATWLHTFFPTANWTTPGGSFAATPSLTIATPASGTASSSVQAAILADVQSMLNSPAQNFGWLLKTDELQSGTARRIDSREHLLGTPPVLTVLYITPGQSTTWGTGCPVGAGTFQHSWVGAPVGGTSPLLTQSNGPANALAANLLSLSYDPVGFPLLPQCNLYLPVTGLIVNHSIITLDGTGGGSTPLNLPAGFPGVTFTSQSAALANTPSGYVLSNVAVALLQ